MPHTLIIFGASGDLTSRKLIPALYRLDREGRLPEATRVVGFSRTVFSHDAWRDELRKSTSEFLGDAFDAGAWDEFAARLFYHAGDIKRAEDFVGLKRFLDELDGGDGATRVYYLSTLPQLYDDAISAIGSADLACEDCGPRRIVIEKPFGSDLVSARDLNAKVHEVFAEHQVYRIDHYLGKETVQNLLVLRFANSIFEPLWNRNFIDHVQITVAEEVAVGDRAPYYEQSGVLRDMFQNHLLQLMTITAMEAPARYEADLIRDEKVKVLRSVRRLAGADFAESTVRGQYEGYRQEKGVAADSQRATFAAMELAIDNWRWNGVPFYLRSGKAMGCKASQIVIQFRQPPLMLFADSAGPSPQGRGGGEGWHDANRLLIQVQPAEGIQLHFQTKVPDGGMKLQMNDLDFSFRREFAGDMPDAYQRLLLDAFKGDASLFARSDEVELAWGIIDPILSAWASNAGDGPAAPPLEIYPVDAWGPRCSTDWMHKKGRNWFDVCPDLEKADQA